MLIVPNKDARNTGKLLFESDYIRIAFLIAKLAIQISTFPKSYSISAIPYDYPFINYILITICNMRKSKRNSWTLTGEI